MQRNYDIIIIGTGFEGKIAYALASTSKDIFLLKRGEYILSENAISIVPNKTVFQKTFFINDFYFGSSEDAKPSGHFHLMGKHKWKMIRAVPNKLLKVFASHSVDWRMQSEDLPNVENRVEIAKNKQIKVYHRPNNQKAHCRLRYQFKKVLRQAGFSIIFGIPMSLKVINHQGGTCRFGSDLTVNVLDLNCHTHDIDNLYMVDSSFFPSIRAMNPTMPTIVANALRVAKHLKQRLNVSLDGKAVATKTIKV